MKNIRIYINGVDAENYGVVLGEKSLTALMTPPPMKNFIENKSALEHGKRVVHSNKVDERNVQLTFGLMATSTVQFISRYREFCNLLQNGTIQLTVSGKEGKVEVFRVTYFLNYISCSQYTEFNGKLAKFMLKLNEPNPGNRLEEK